MRVTVISLKGSGDPILLSGLNGVRHLNCCRLWVGLSVVFLIIFFLVNHRNKKTFVILVYILGQVIWCLKWLLEVSVVSANDLSVTLGSFCMSSRSGRATEVVSDDDS